MSYQVRPKIARVSTSDETTARRTARPCGSFTMHCAGSGAAIRAGSILINALSLQPMPRRRDSGQRQQAHADVLTWSWVWPAEHPRVMQRVRPVSAAGAPVRTTSAPTADGI